jgi:hypothetical protein
MSDFSKHGMGAMSAARSVFGDRSGGELVSKISELVGSSAVDLGSEKGASEVENLLRKTNATARVAGISIKTMLAIIDSTRQLAANNPALQNMNAGASTEIALKAVGTAARMGSQMSAEEYRKAGGSQGIAAKEIESGAAFVASDLGGAQLALIDKAYSISKEKGDAMMERVKRGEITADKLTNEGKLDELAQELGMSSQDLNFNVLQNQMAHEEARKNKGLAEFGATEAMKATTVGSIKDRFKEQGLDMDAEFVKSGGNMSVVKRKMIEASAGDEEMQRSLKQYMPQIENHYRDFGKSPEEIAKFDNLVKQQAEREAQMSKDLDARHAGLTSQVFDATMKGTSVQDALAQYSKIYAVSGGMSTETKAKMEEAQKAGGNLLEMMTGPDGRKRTDQDLLNLRSESGGSLIIESLNKKIEASRAQALESGDTASAKLLKNIPIADGATPEQQGEVFQQAMSTLKNRGYDNAEEARADLKNLQERADRGEQLAPEMQQLKQALEYTQPILASNEGFGKFQKSGYSTRGFVAAFDYAHAERATKQELDSKKNELIDKDLSSQLTELATGTAVSSEAVTQQKDVQEIFSKYRGSDGQVDFRKMYEEYHNRDKGGAFAEMAGTAEGRVKLERLEQGGFGQKMAGLSNTMEDWQKKAMEQGGAAGPAGMGDVTGAMGGLKESMDQLKNQLSPLSEISGAISGLANSLSTLLSGGTASPIVR